MRIIKLLVISIIVGGTILAWTLAGQAAPLSEPAAQVTPVIISDDTFDPADWQVYDVSNQGGGSYQVRQETSGGNPGAYRWIEQVIPPVPTGQVYQISLTHLYLGASYDPASQGAIATLAFAESVRIVASNNPQPFMRSIPVVVQGGRIYRATTYLDSVATANWENLSASGLGEQDFVALDDSSAHPDFSGQGQSLSFGFFRGLSRTQTLPAMPPANQNLTLQHGIDNWQVTITPLASGNNPPVANPDIYVAETDSGYLSLEFNVLLNDVDPDGDRLAVTEVGQPAHGSAGFFGFTGYVFYLQDGRKRDSFSYTISDGELSATTGVGIYVDCGCSISCLMENVARPAATDTLDLALIRRVRDRVMRPTPDGNRYVEMYYTTTPEIAKILMLDRTDLGDEAVDLVELWQPNLYSLVDGDGSATITQPQVDAMETFLANMSTAGSTDLQQLINSELTRLGPLDEYVGMTVKEAKRQAIGDAVIYLPLVIKQ